MHARRWLSFVGSLGLAATAFGPVAVPAAAVAPVTVHYPNVDEGCPAQEDTGLQDCIDSVPSGSTVILTSEINGNNGALITKSLTLRAADRSLHPKLFAVAVRIDGTSPSTADVTVQDITLDYFMSVDLTQGSGHQVHLRRLEVGKAYGNSQGMTVSTTVPASVTIEDSYIRSSVKYVSALYLEAQDPDGSVRFQVIGNRITAHGNSNSAEGIRSDMSGDGTVRIDIDNNTIWDVARCECGAASGISIDPSGPIHADVNIVGNTIERSPTNAIQQRNGLTGGGHLSLDVFDNVFSHHGRSAIDLDKGVGSSLTFRAGYNDYFASAASHFDGKSKGSHNLSSDPRFVDRASGNLKLRSNSPLIDAGQVCSPGGVAITDAAGNTRLHGASVDIGALERGATSATGRALVGTSGGNTLTGTSGADILCGYAGKDVLKGLAGADYLDGGSSDDKLTGGSGTDRQYGGPGRDKLCSHDGVHGNDYLNGGAGSDSGQRDSGDTQVSIEASASC